MKYEFRIYQAKKTLFNRPIARIIGTHVVQIEDQTSVIIKNGKETVSIITGGCIIVRGKLISQNNDRLFPLTKEERNRIIEAYQRES